MSAELTNMYLAVSSLDIVHGISLEHLPEVLLPKAVSAVQSDRVILTPFTHEY